MNDSKVVIIIVLAVALVGSLFWGFSNLTAKNDLKQDKTALVVKVEKSQDCIDAWGNLSGYEDYDVYGNSVWVVPEDSWASMGNDCDQFMGD